jgi:hypothetical protein
VAVEVLGQAARFVRAIGSTWIAIDLDLYVARALASTGDREGARAPPEKVRREATEHGHLRTAGEAAKLSQELA